MISLLNRFLVLTSLGVALLACAEDGDESSKNPGEIQALLNRWQSDEGQNRILANGWMTPSRTTPDELHDEEVAFLMTHALPKALEDCYAFSYRILDEYGNWAYEFLRPKPSDNPTCSTFVSRSMSSLAADDTSSTSFGPARVCDFRGRADQMTIQMESNMPIMWRATDTYPHIEDWLVDACEPAHASSEQNEVEPSGFPVGSGCHMSDISAIYCGDDSTCDPYVLPGDKTAQVGICVQK